MPDKEEYIKKQANRLRRWFKAKGKCEFANEKTRNIDELTLEQFLSSLRDEIRNEAIEDCARIADGSRYATRLSVRIRALKIPSPQKGT